MGEQSPLPPELGRLSTFIDSHIECLAGSNGELRSLALCATKHIFDWALETEDLSMPHLKILLATLTETIPPQTRSRTRGSPTTQRRSANSVHKRQTKINIRETPLPALFTEGMNTDQIWQQLDLRASRVCENLQVLQGENEGGDTSSDDSSDGRSEDGGAEMDVDDDDESAWEGLSGEDGEDEDSSTAEADINLQEESSEDDGEDISGVPMSIMDVIRSQQQPMSPRIHTQGYTKLDDGFFDLATFNAETNEAETKMLSGRKLELDAGDDSDGDSEVDLFGSVVDPETEGEDGSHELFYNDFFVPPGRMENGSSRSSKVRFHERVTVKKIKAVGRGMPVSYVDNEDDEDEDG